MHEALAVWYQNGVLQDAINTFLVAYPAQLDLNDKAKTREHGVQALTDYFELYGMDLFNWEILSVEKRETSEDDYVVKLDLVVKDKETRQILGIDHKITGSYLDYKFFSKFEPNNQVSEYVRHIKTVYGYCDGFIINAVSLKHRSRKYKDEPAGPWHKFERQTFNRNDAQLEQDYQDRCSWMERIEESHAANDWPKNTEACWNCEYRAICSVGWTVPDDLELITNDAFYVACAERGPNEEHCNQEAGHIGEYGQIEESDFEISIAVSEEV